MKRGKPLREKRDERSEKRGGVKRGEEWKEERGEKRRGVKRGEEREEERKEQRSEKRRGEEKEEGRKEKRREKMRLRDASWPSETRKRCVWNINGGEMVRRNVKSKGDSSRKILWSKCEFCSEAKVMWESHEWRALKRGERLLKWKHSGPMGETERSGNEERETRLNEARSMNLGEGIVFLTGLIRKFLR